MVSLSVYYPLSTHGKLPQILDILHFEMGHYLNENYYDYVNVNRAKT